MNPQPNFFSEGSPYLNHPLLTGARAAGEVEFLISQLGLQAGDRILDVGCGFGRHTIELAQRGYSVVGIDPSSTMLQAAREHAAQMGVAPEFHQALGQDYKSELAFDAAICLFTTLGQITAEGDNSSMLANIHRLLRPGGALAVEVPQRQATIKTLKVSDRFGTDTHFSQVKRHYDPHTETITELFTVVAPQNSRHYTLRYRLYSRIGLEDLLDESGFDVTAQFGDYQGAPLELSSPFMILISRQC